jgi:PAS domain S-box-containing protein
MHYTFEYWPTAVIVFIGALANIYLFLYLRNKFPLNPVSKSFSLFVISSILWQLQDFFTRISADYYTANIWYRFFIPGILFAGATGLHFALEFTNKLNKKNRFYTTALIYLPGLIFMFMYLSGMYDFDLEHIPIWNWGYKGDTNNLFLLGTVFYIGSTATLTVILLFINAYNKLYSNKDKLSKQQAFLAFIGYTIPGAVGLVGEIYFPFFTPWGDQRVTTIGLILMNLSIFLALKKYRLFDYSPAYAIDEIINSIKDSVVITDKDFIIRYANNTFEKLTKFENDTILGKYISIILKENSSLNEEYFYGEKDLNENNSIETIIYTKNDMPVWVTINKKSIIDKFTNEVIGYLFTLNDITDLKHAEELLELSDKKYKDVINTIEEGIIQVNKLNEVIFFNNKTIDILELPKQKIAFKNINSIFNKNIIPIDGYDQLKVKETTYISPNGNIKWFLLNIKPLESFKDGYLISISDITQLKEKEFEILNSIYETQERERKRIAEELHDGLAQTLAAANMYLNALNDKIAVSQELDTNTIANFIETKKILKQSLQETREISHDLMPIAISEYGLRKSINDLITKINKVNPNLVITFYSNFKDLRINPEIELALYRITQEIINNTLKHANATQLKINLYYRNGFTVLISQDNGVGFNLNEKKSSGLGISNFENRVIAFNGKMKIKSRLGEGTKIYIGIPTRPNEK